MADKLINPVFATAAVLARVAFALVHVAKAPSVVIASGALAPEAVHQVYAYAAVGARVRRALVYVVLAVASRVALPAFAGVTVNWSVFAW